MTGEGGGGGRGVKKKEGREGGPTANVLERELEVPGLLRQAVELGGLDCGRDVRPGRRHA